MILILRPLWWCSFLRIIPSLTTDWRQWNVSAPIAPLEPRAKATTQAATSTVNPEKGGKMKCSG